METVAGMMDDATFAPVRRAFIDAEAAAADADRLRAAAEASQVETERALLGDRAAVRDRDAERILRTIDPAKARDLRDIESQLTARREGQANVERLLAETQAKVDELRAPLLDRYRRAPEPAPEIMLPAEYGPTIKATPQGWGDAVARAEADGKGQIIGALYNDELGHVVAPWAIHGDDDHGLAGLIRRGRRDVVDRLPEIVRAGRVEKGKTRARIFTEDHGAAIRLDFRRERGNGPASRGSPWLLTAWRKEDNAGAPKSARSAPEGVTVNSSPPPASRNISAIARKLNVRDEPPVPAGMARVYHSGSRGEGQTGRWVSTDRQYASDYRRDLPLFYLDIPENDPRINDAFWPDQGWRNGHTFNFETTPEEATALREIDRGSGEGKRHPPAFAENDAVTTLRRAFAGTGDERAAAHRKLGEMVEALQRREDYDPKVHGQATVDLLTHALGGDPDRVVSSLARDAAGADVDVTFRRGLDAAGRGDALSEMIDACKAR
jgi:hypothetical protein